MLKRSTVVLALLLTVGAAAARADPISFGGVITSGSLVSAPPFGATYSFAGNGFSVGLARNADLGSMSGFCFPCVSGETVRFGGVMAGSSLGNGPVTVGSQSFDAWWSGGFNWEFGFTLPQDAGPMYTIMTPFTFTGQMTGWSTDVRGGDNSVVLVRATNLAGSGVATMVFHTLEDSEAGRLFTAQSIRFDFQDASMAPIPEPATMTLLGLGLAGLAARRKRRGHSPAANRG